MSQLFKLVLAATIVDANIDQFLPEPGPDPREKVLTEHDIAAIQVAHYKREKKRTMKSMERPFNE